MLYSSTSHEVLAWFTFLAYAGRPIGRLGVQTRSNVQTRLDVHERLKSLVKILTYGDFQLEPSNQAERYIYVPRWILRFETPRNPASYQVKRLDLHRHIATDSASVPRCVLCICARFPPCQRHSPPLSLAFARRPFIIISIRRMGPLGL